MRPLISALLATALVGCTSMMQAISSDPVRETALRDRDRNHVVTMVSLDSTRRSVIVAMSGEDNKAGKFCAEPPPDVAQEITSKFLANLSSEAEALPFDAQVQDNFDTTAIILVQRTALMDVYRTGTYALCQFHLNEAITGSDLKELFLKLTTATIDGLARSSLE